MPYLKIEYCPSLHTAHSVSTHFLIAMDGWSTAVSVGVVGI